MSKPLTDLATRVMTEHLAVTAAFKKGVERAMAAGDLLIEAKVQLKHGQWLPWLTESCRGLSVRMAQLYMRLAKEREAIEANAKDLTHLTIEDAIDLLSPSPVPAIERSDEWRTPAEYVEAARSVLGGIDLDPASSDLAQEVVRAARYHTLADDGLAHPWRGGVWLNPPFTPALITRFVDKLVAEHDAGNVHAAILLTHASTDTRWFRTAAQAAAAFCFTQRIRFVDPIGNRRAPKQGQCFTYFGQDIVRFVAVFAKFGTLMIPWRAGTAFAAEAAE
jgi:phage N-6-adenine-methyltransferase